MTTKEGEPRREEQGESRQNQPTALGEARSRINTTRTPTSYYRPSPALDNPLLVETLPHNVSPAPEEQEMHDILGR